MTAAANVEIDPRRYGQLLVRVLPVMVKTAGENERLLTEIERLMDKGEDASPEELTLLELMSRLVEDFEEEHYPVPEAEPHAALRHLMEQRDMQPKDLLPVFSSRGYVSLVPERQAGHQQGEGEDAGGALSRLAGVVSLSRKRAKAPQKLYTERRKFNPRVKRYGYRHQSAGRKNPAPRRHVGDLRATAG